MVILAIGASAGRQNFTEKNKQKLSGVSNYWLLIYKVDFSIECAKPLAEAAEMGLVTSKIGICLCALIYQPAKHQ